MTPEQAEELAELKRQYQSLEAIRRHYRRVAESSPAARAAREGKNGRMRARAAEAEGLKDPDHRMARNKSLRLRRKIIKLLKAVGEAPFL